MVAISIKLKDSFLQELDRFLKNSDQDRSQFIRDAIQEKLNREGVNVPKDSSSATSRLGKGGRRPHPEKEDTNPPKLSNEHGSASSKRVEKASNDLANVAHQLVRHGDQERSPSPATGAPSAKKAQPSRDIPGRCNRPRIAQDEAPTEHGK